MSKYLTLEEKKQKYGVGIWTVLDFLGIEIPDKSNFYIFCQNCGDTQRRKRNTLNINIEKEAFRCPRCGVSGGFLDLFSLYYYGEILNNYTKGDMIRDMKKSNFNYKDMQRSKKQFVFKPKPEEPLLDIVNRSNVYNKLLSYCTLSNKDKKDLYRRGLNDKAIQMLNYKSTPYNTDQIAHKLRYDGLSLKGVPGFYKSKNNNSWSIKKMKGYYIPYRDLYGNIQGFQIRTESKDFKYIWLSSKDLDGGSKARTWSHFANTFTHQKNNLSKIIITEGGLKADIINYFTGIPTIGIPGVNSIAHFEIMIKDILNINPNVQIFTAFDMDYLTNEFVEKAYNTLISTIQKYTLNIHVFKWNDNYNNIDTSGLDDYLYQLHKTGKIDFFTERQYLK